MYTRGYGLAGTDYWRVAAGIGILRLGRRYNECARDAAMGGRTAMRHIGLVLAGVWLVLTGLIELVGLRFQGLTEVMAVLAIVAGVLMILRR